MTKKLLCALLALLLAGALGAALAEENLLANGDFSEYEDGVPDGWRQEMWLKDAGVSLLSVDPNGYEGACVCVTNIDANAFDGCRNGLVFLSSN